MSNPSLATQDEISAVNQILTSCGQAPVTTLDQTNPDVAIAFQTLNEVSREVQAEGWVFNTERELEFPVDNNNEVPIPPNVIQMDLSHTPSNNQYQVIRRNGKLYDKISHTDKFPDVDSFLCDVTYLFDWVDLPVPAKDFITARASSIVSMRIVGDPNQYQILQQREAYTRAVLAEYECTQGDYTFFGTPGRTNNYSAYKPYQALYR
jgi:hypothetical protein|tara:strand:- start:1182 stop:1802 length:621 start_codon:yes stop_codon:yes gene_type:complete